MNTSYPLSKWEGHPISFTQLKMEVLVRAGESRSEARGNISFEGPIGPENTSGEGGGGSPLRLARRAPYYALGHLLYLGAWGK